MQSRFRRYTYLYERYKVNLLGYKALGMCQTHMTIYSRFCQRGVNSACLRIKAQTRTVCVATEIIIKWNLRITFICAKNLHLENWPVKNLLHFKKARNFGSRVKLSK